MLIAIAQTNFTVGDIAGNIQKITALHKQAAARKADLIVFSEMGIVGYPPEDLVLRKRFQKEAMEAVKQLAKLTTSGTAILTGGLASEAGAAYNAAFLLDKGKVIATQYKHNLPNYGVFDEKRTFAEGPVPNPIAWRGKKLGLMICEDMWKPELAKHFKKKGTDLLLVINASPYEVEKHALRVETARARVKEAGLPLIYVNQVGGQDEVVFDGRSFVMNKAGKVVAELKTFEEDIAFVNVGRAIAVEGAAKTHTQGVEESIYNAMKLGLRDYVRKNRFAGVVIGMSGGIDSALTAAVAVDALGAKAVHAVMMPSPYTSVESIEDAELCCKALGIPLDSVSIAPAMQVFEKMLKPLFVGRKPDTTEENIQSRLRGNLLMAISNKTGKLVITTGNKSEMAVGYATLYGDMCGGFNVLKDIYKTTVYKLANWRNKQSPVIPKRIITKAPSAELKPNQTDQDSLPPYEVLDAILQLFIEQQMSVAEMVAKGHDRKTVENVARMVIRAEYKRRQAPPGVKISPMSFGRDRRYPLTDGWKA